MSVKTVCSLRSMRKCALRRGWREWTDSPRRLCGSNQEICVGCRPKVARASFSFFFFPKKLGVCNIYLYGFS